MHHRIITICAVVVVALGTSGIAYFYYDQWHTERLRRMGFDSAVAAHEGGDHELAFEVFRMRALQGHFQSQRALAHFYEQGIGTPQDHYEAISVRLRLADQGDIDSMYRLGQLYDQQRSPSTRQQPDYAREAAIRWYRRAAEEGNTAAQTALGARLVASSEAESDREEGLRWIGMAIGAGYSEAKAVLGRIHQRGRLGEPDYPLALRWCEEAATDGNYTGLDCTIQLLADEDLPTFDLEQAYVWSLVARHWWRHDTDAVSHFDAGIQPLLRERPEFEGPRSTRSFAATNPDEAMEAFREFERSLGDFENWPIRMDEQVRLRAEAAANDIIARSPNPPWSED